MHWNWIRQLDVVVIQKKTRRDELVSHDATRHTAPDPEPLMCASVAVVQDATRQRRTRGSFRGGYASRVIRTPTTGVRRPSGPHFALPHGLQYPHSETAL